MFLNDLRNKKQEHKDIKNILEKDYGYTIKSPAYGNSAKKALQQIKDAKQDLYRDFTVEEYNRVVLFEKYLEQLVELDANKWGKGNPNVGGAMALDPTWGGGLRGAGMGAEVTQGHASEKEVKEWLGTNEGKAFVTQFKTHGGNVDAAMQDPKLMGMAPAGVIGSVLTANRILMMGRAGVLVAPFLVSNPIGWTILVAVGVIATGAVIAHLVTNNKDKETIGSTMDREGEAIASATGDREGRTTGRDTDRDSGRTSRLDPVMSQDGELDPNAGIPAGTAERIRQSIEDVGTEIKLGDPNALKDKAAHMNAADNITAIMSSMNRDLEDLDPEGGAKFDDPTTDARLKVSDPRSEFGVSQQGVEVPIDRTKAADAIPQTGVSQADISSAIATFKAAETDKAVSATAAAIAGADVRYDDQEMKDARLIVGRGQGETPGERAAYAAAKAQLARDEYKTGLGDVEPLEDPGMEDARIVVGRGPGEKPGERAAYAQAVAQVERDAYKVGLGTVEPLEDPGMEDARIVVGRGQGEQPGERAAYAQALAQLARDEYKTALGKVEPLEDPSMEDARLIVGRGPGEKPGERAAYAQAVAQVARDEYKAGLGTATQIDAPSMPDARLQVGRVDGEKPGERAAYAQAVAQQTAAAQKAQDSAAAAAAAGVSMGADYVIPKDIEWGKGRDRHPPITVPTGVVPGTGEVPVDWAGGRDRHPPITGQGVVPGTGTADTTDTGTSTGDKDKVADREQALDREKERADRIAAAQARAAQNVDKAEIVTTTTGAPAIINPKKDKKKGGGKLKYLGLAALLGGAAAKKKADKKGRRIIPEPPAQTQLGIGSRWPGGVINASYSPQSNKIINSSIIRRGNVMNEEATFKNLKKLLEQDLDQAELALAAKDMVVQLQDIAEDLAKMQVENLMPLVDRIKEEYGPEAGEQFNGSVESALGSALEGIKGTHQQVQDAVLVLTGEKSAMSTDMGTDDMPMDMGDTDMDDGLGGDDEISLDGADAAAGPADMSLGRAVKKESVVKAKRALQTALREGKYSDKVLRKIIKSMK